MKVAVLNLKGLLNKEVGNMELAKQAFQDALNIAPDFSLAKSNLDALDK